MPVHSSIYLAVARVAPFTPITWQAGPASYGMTDTLGRIHSDAQFAGSSSVPAHVEMMGFLGIGNNPIEVSSTLTVYLNKISRNPFGCGRFFVRINLIIFKKVWFIYIKLPIFARRLITGKRDVI